MLKIGITGNIGSGKTIVCKIFETLGIPVFYADEAAKKAMVSDPLLVNAIKGAFGAGSYFDDGSLNRKLIAEIVFKDEAKLKLLNSIVHPATFRAFDIWVSKQNKELPCVLKEAALLFETDAWKDCDVTVLVTAPIELRIERVIKRNGLTEKEILSRDARQFPESVKAGLATHILINDDTQLLIPQVLELNGLFSRLKN